MKKFDWTCFTKKTAVKAKLSTIYDAWTKSEEIESWFLEKADYFRDGQSKIKKSESVSNGDHYEWSWYLYDIVEKGKINIANGVDHIQFTFAKDCIVDVRLEKSEENTIVSLSQSNIPTDDESKQSIRLGCESGWSFYLVNLKSVYEGGLDLRNKEAELKVLLNN